MKKCSKSIVECLRDYKIEPSTEANSYIARFPPQNAINYSNNENFHADFYSSQRWWMIDFKTQVSIDSYMFGAGSVCDFIKYWQVSVSDDNITWKVADSPPQQFAENKTFELKYPASARYFKVSNIKGDCGYTMVFYYIKFFGSYLILKKTQKCIKTNRTNSLLYQIILLIYS